MELEVQEQSLAAESQDHQDGEIKDDEQEDGELVIAIGEPEVVDEEEQAKKAPEWVRELRKKTREQEKRIREQEAQIAALSGANKKPVLGKKPSLSDDGIDFDEDKFEAALTAWHDKKREVEAEEAKKQQEAQKAEQTWNERVTAFNEQREAVKAKLPDYEDAEQDAMGKLSQIQQGIIVGNYDNPSHVFYALGKNEAKLAELAAITDPIKYTIALTNMVNKMTVTTRKPSPESRPAGQQASAGGPDKQLDRLREEAQRTGDYSKLTAYKKQLRNK